MSKLRAELYKKYSALELNPMSPSYSDQHDQTDLELNQITINRSNESSTIGRARVKQVPVLCSSRFKGDSTKEFAHSNLRKKHGGRIVTHARDGVERVG